MHKVLGLFVYIRTILFKPHNCRNGCGPGHYTISNYFKAFVKWQCFVYKFCLLAAPGVHKYYAVAEFTAVISQGYEAGAKGAKPY